MHSKRSHEGYLLIDHSESPGLSDRAMAFNGKNLPSGAGRGALERGIVQCGHCSFGMMVTPLEAVDLCYCRKCDRYICDDCKLAQVMTGDCRSIDKIIDQAQEAAFRGLPLPNLERTHG